MLVGRSANASPHMGTPVTPPPASRFGRTLLVMMLSSVAERQLNSYSWNVGGLTILWLSNAVLLGALLCSVKSDWPVCIGMAAVLDLLLNLSLGNPSLLCVYVTGCNMFEAIGAAMLLSSIISPRPDLTESRQFLAFLGFGVFLMPAITACLAPFASTGKFEAPSLHGCLGWFAADSLGIATVTPLYLAWYQKSGLVRRTRAETIVLVLLLSGVTAGTFSQTRAPLLFLVLPTLFLLGVRLGLAGSALGLLFVTLVGGFASTAGHGPIGLMTLGSMPARDIVFQLFILTSMLLLYVTEVQTTASRRLQSGLQGSERRFRLLAEASSDIIVLSDLDGTRRYVSPAALEVLGWNQQEALERKVGDAAHPEDQSAVEQLFQNCRDGGPARSLQYRCLNSCGSYVWLEISLRLFRNAETAEPAGFVSVTRDISLRKAEEEEKRRALAAAEHLARFDALTGVANRRQFDLVLEQEWQRGAREQTELSLLLLDVDRFKAYNDLYGHQAGDECLRRVAQALEGMVRRPADLLARYGGEEFVLVLPRTDAPGALQLAERARWAVEERELPHSGNPPFLLTTVSVGCGTVIPQPGTTPAGLIEATDRALYQAKSSGRNQIKAAFMAILDGQPPASL